MNKAILKSGLFSAILLISVSLSAQVQGQRRSQNRNQGQRSMPAFNAKNAVGIIKYNAKKIIKKTNIKNEEKRGEVVKVFSAYNQTIDEIKLLNSEKLKDVERFVNETQKNAMATRDRDAMRFARKKANEKLAPIKNQIIIADQELNTSLKQILSEEQFERWMKYRQFKKKALQPNLPERMNNNSGGYRRDNGNGH